VGKKIYTYHPSIFFSFNKNFLYFSFSFPFTPPKPKTITTKCSCRCCHIKRKREQHLILVGGHLIPCGKKYFFIDAINEKEKNFNQNN